ncbi:MAG TPA: hypothetical protein VJ696_01420 [Rhodanobacteraceae bacterium]|nr:hypothetical protein [Rhodanobacteraceae bacterium]
MSDFVLIAVGSLVPILALTLALASGGARGGDPADGAPEIVGEGFADDAGS